MDELKQQLIEVSCARE